MGIESSKPDNIGNRLEDAPVESIYDVGFEGDGRSLKPGATLGAGMFEDDVKTQAEDLGILLVEGVRLLIHKYQKFLQHNQLQEEWKN